MFFAPWRRPALRKAVCGAMFLALLVFLAALKWQRNHGGDLVMTALDVGHGQAVCVQFPAGYTILFDAGSLYKSDVGTRTVAPFLRYAGIDRINAIVISHNDIDHVNGIPEVLAPCRVQAVYANHAFLTEKDSWSTAKFLNDRLAERGFSIQPLPERLSPDEHVRTTILWPGDRAGAEELSENDRSLVCLLEFAGRKILLCSDIEQSAQREIMRLHPELKADIVVVPHHGSQTTADPHFLESLDPAILIYSCARTQYERLRQTGQKTGAASFYTPRYGAVTARINSNGAIETTTFLRQKKQLPANRELLSKVP